MEATLINDARIEPYFIKLVNSAYEVHQNHVPKDADKKPYSKFICTKTNIRSALTTIASLKLAVKRRTKKSLLLQEFLDEIKIQQSVVEELLDDDSPERKIRLLEKRIGKLEEEVKKAIASSKIMNEDSGITIEF